MDLSKLPKFSNTPAPPPQTPEAPAKPLGGEVELFCQCGAPISKGTNFCSHCGAPYHQAVGGIPDRTAHDDYSRSSMLVEAFLCIAVGLFLIFMASNGIKYYTAKLTGGTFAPFLPPPGYPPESRVDFLRYKNLSTQVETDYRYRDLFDHFWNDTAITAFALALILEGIILAFVRNRWIILLGALLIAAATLLNVWYVFASFTRVSPISGATYGFPPLSFIAVIFGVIMTVYQVRMFADLRRR